MQQHYVLAVYKMSHLQCNITVYSISPATCRWTNSALSQFLPWCVLYKHVMKTTYIIQAYKYSHVTCYATAGQYSEIIQYFNYNAYFIWQYANSQVWLEYEFEVWRKATSVVHVYIWKMISIQAEDGSWNLILATLGKM